jgi:hypothetical protein
VKDVVFPVCFPFLFRKTSDLQGQRFFLVVGLNVHFIHLLDSFVIRGEGGEREEAINGWTCLEASGFNLGKSIRARGEDGSMVAYDGVSTHSKSRGTVAVAGRSVGWTIGLVRQCRW